MKALYGLIGHPLGHSISGKIHRRLYEYYNVEADYLHFDLLPEEIPVQMKKFRQSFRGFNVTIPYKKEIIQYLDEIKDDGALFGAVNTVVIDGGKAVGYNTDGLGFMKMLRQNGISVDGKNVIVLGAGGAGCALAQKIGTEGAKKVMILNRSQDRAWDVAERVKRIAGCKAGADTLENADLYLEQCDVLINTTSLGMHPYPEENPLTNTKKLKSSTAVVDIIYNPGKTKLLQEAEEKGCVTVNGLGMLLYQAFFAFELWTGIMPSDELAQQLVKELAF